MNKMKYLAVATLLFSATCVSAAQPRFEYKDIAAGRFDRKGIEHMTSTASGEDYTVLKKDAILKYSYRSGQLTDTVCDFSLLSDNVKVADYLFSSDEKKLLLKTDANKLYRRSDYSRYLIYDCANSSAVPLVDSDSVRYAVFSPDATKVAYVLHNNIYIKTLADNRVKQVTFDGRFNHIINGLPDWVYEEEFSLRHALRWSPDGTMLAYVRSDESRVKEFSFVKYPQSANGYSSIYTYKYPVAGETNSVVELYSYDLNSDSTTKIDSGTETDRYIPDFDWTPDNRLYFFVLNRLQNHLEVLLCDGNNGRKTIYEETSDKYIDEVDSQTITFLDDSDMFIARGETRDGFYHLYLYDIGRGFIAPVTSGQWDVTSLVYADKERVVYLSTEGSVFGNNLYSIDINGKNKKCLTSEHGTYSVSASSGFRYYISTFSNTSTPSRTTLYNGKGKVVRVLEDNRELNEYIDSLSMPQKEFVSFTTPEGVELFGYVIKPSDFDESKRYPVLFSQYSGPASRQVIDSWDVDWEDVLVQNGYIVACFDPRGTGGRGEAFKKLTYGKLGELETSDQIYAARYMASLQYVDASRIGIYGWSYGGFMALNCILKGGDVFKMAISVAPVTSWRYYDSVYTERYNGLPQDNPQGYDNPSPIGYAEGLKGKLLLIHGTGDDNVHIINSHQMARNLVDAQKQFDMMIYTDTNHSMMPGGATHIREKMIEYCLENL